MPANYTALGYCTETDIENYLLLTIDSSFANQITDWIAAGEQWVNRYLGYTTNSGILMEEFTNEVSQTAFVDDDLNLVIHPRKAPISSVSALSIVKGTTSLALSLTSSGTNRYQLPEPKHRFVMPSSELSLTGSSIINSFGELKHMKFFAQMSYIAGYSAVPADIRMATTMIVSDFVMRHANKEGLQSLTQGRVTKSWFERQSGTSDFFEDAKSLLNPYRLAANWI